jgi:hypothetical protein
MAQTLRYCIAGMMVVPFTLPPNTRVQPQPVNRLTSDTGAHIVLEDINQEPDNVIRRPAGFAIA